MNRYIKKYLPLILVISAPMTGRASNSIVTDIASYVYPANAVKGAGINHFMPSEDTYLQSEGDRIIKKYDLKTGNEIGTVFDASKTREAHIDTFDSFNISPDGSRLLLATNTTSIYRRSTASTYYVYDIKRNILKPLSRENSTQQCPLFSPDSRMIAFVADNDIWLRKLDYDTEIKVTDDGAAGMFINGATDWTYEEEFQITSTMTWSGDNEMLCFVTFDERDVPVYTLPLYQGSCDPLNQYALYPGSLTYKYPVAGERNSTVTVKSYDVSTRKTVELKISDRPIDYIPRIDFVPGGTQLLVTTLNRDQNRLEIFSVNPRSTISKSIFVEESDCWLEPEIYENLVITPQSLIINSSRTGYNNLYEYNLTGSPLRTLTNSDYDITHCYGISADGTVWYQSVGSSPLNRALHRIDPKKGDETVFDIDRTTWAQFNQSMSYMIVGQSSATTPPQYSLADGRGKIIRTLENNEAVIAKYAGLPEKEFITIMSDGVSLNAYIIKPLNFTPGQKYPVIMTQYSGPGSQEVLNKWSVDWQQYASINGYVVVCVDPRGTGGRGRKFMDVVYRNLGYYETIDQINAANYIAGLDYVDGSRIGICGWSYGGYETLMCMTDRRSPFKAGVAIAPVTDWRYYDTVYAERYMLTPQANEDGYNASAPISRAANLSGRLLIMSGTADDNVHPANTFEFVSKLQCNGILCDMLMFPNMNHSIFGCNARSVVYGKMIDYFNQNL